MATLHTIYHSGFGHTKLQAQSVHHGASSVSGVQTHLWTVEEAISRINDLDQTDAMIFGCPTYMGSMSAEMKKFVIDRSDGIELRIGTRPSSVHW